MKKVLTSILTLLVALFLGPSLMAQMAYMPSPMLNDDPLSIKVEEETTYNIEEVKGYLPLEDNTLFDVNEDNEDLSNYLPLEAPLFGANSEEVNLPLESENGYFLETSSAYTESSYAVYADNAFKEIIVSFDAAKEEDIRVNLYNTVGINIQQVTYNTGSGINNFSLDVEDLPKGLYTLKLTGSQQNIIKKFVIK